MKKLLLFLLASFLLGDAISQNLNNASHTNIDQMHSIVSIHSKSYYLQSVKSCCGSSTYVGGLDQNGNSIFKVNITSSYDFPKKIVKTADKCLLIFGWSNQACDVGGNKDFIVKVDTNGIVIFKKFIQSTWGQGYLLTDLSSSSDTSFYLSSDNLVYNYSKNGNLLNTLNPGMSAIKSILALSNGNLLIHGNLNNQLVNAEFDPANSVIIAQQSTSYGVFKFEKTASGNFVALTSAGEIIKYDQSLSFLSIASSLTNSNVKVGDFTTRNDSVFVAGSNLIAGAPYYALLNSTFSILNFSQPAYKGISLKGIAVTNKNKIDIVTDGFSASTQFVTFTSLYHFPVTGGFNSTRDIGVISIKGLNSIIKHPNIYQYMPIAELEATVKNFGTDTVKDFYLNSYYANSFCPFVLHKACHATIAPGATATVLTGTFVLQNSIIMVPLSPNGSTIKTKMCVFTTIPDYTNDIEINNDGACDSVQFVVAGIKENDFLSRNIRLYPNPFENELKVESEILIKNVELVNSLGVLISSKVVNDKVSVFDNSELAPGIYFIKVETEKSSLTKKVVKQ